MAASEKTVEIDFSNNQSGEFTLEGENWLLDCCEERGPISAAVLQPGVDFGRGEAPTRRGNRSLVCMLLGAWVKEHRDRASDWF